MRLTLRYDGRPDTAEVVDAESMSVVEGIKSFTLQRKEPLSADELTITLIIPRQPSLGVESPSEANA
jgi:hypothetical protein